MATIKDIADAAGISIGTVDRIIHKRGRYSEKTAMRVREIMQELNYTANIHARGLKNTRKYSFAAVVPKEAQDAGYWRIVSEGIERASDELTSFCDEIKIFHFDRYSSDSCRKVLSAALSSGTDGLLIAPVFPGNVQDLLLETDIPFLFIDTDMPELTERVAFIGQDSFQSGVLSGKLMGLMTAGLKAQSIRSLLIVEPPGSDFHLKSRIEGFKSYFKENFPKTVFEYLKTNTDNEDDFHLILDDYFINNHPLPDGIFVANSSVYYLATFLKKRGEKYCAVPVIGYDLIPGRESLIADEVINFILTQQPEQQAYRGIMLLYDAIVLNKEITKEVIVPLNIITKENLHTF